MHTTLHSPHSANRQQLLDTSLTLSMLFRIVIRVDGWEVDSQYPHGHFVCSLGPIGDVETETRAILVEHGLLSKPFTPAQVRVFNAHLVVRGGGGFGDRD